MGSPRSNAMRVPDCRPMAPAGESGPRSRRAACGNVRRRGPGRSRSAAAAGGRLLGLFLLDQVDIAVHVAVGAQELGGRIASPPRAGGTLRILRGMREDPLGLLAATQREHGDVVAFRFFFWSITLVSHPDGVRHVLQERHTNYSKDNLDYRMLKPVLGNGLLTSEGALWLRQRRLIQPAFHRERIAALGDLMTARTELMLDRWDATRGETLDVASEMSRL
ncbi:MAG: cytochrome P450, partial [Deltaproteobacteria bacterium]